MKSWSPEEPELCRNCICITNLKRGCCKQDIGHTVSQATIPQQNVKSFIKHPEEKIPEISYWNKTWDSVEDKTGQFERNKLQINKNPIICWQLSGPGDCAALTSFFSCRPQLQQQILTTDFCVSKDYLSTSFRTIRNTQQQSWKLTYPKEIEILLYKFHVNLLFKTANPIQELCNLSYVEQTTPHASILLDHKNFMLIFLNSWEALTENILHLIRSDTIPEHLYQIYIYLMGTKSQCGHGILQLSRKYHLSPN